MDSGFDPDKTVPAESAQSVANSKHVASHLRGKLLAGRFRIVRFLAVGGMGEVYEAEDLELGEHVALKTLRQGLAWGDQLIERFKREVYLARKVTHRNVCRIYDVFHHVEPNGEKITFLSMELLGGETLTDRIHRTKTISPDEARPIIRQMTDALAAAHKAGIIHRDFKSSNVMLVPTDNDEHGLRVVVTDFGLARSNASDESMLTVLSSAGELRGTPSYMAPEQLEGGEITAAADIYALGLVMYEMFTGSLPFSGGQGLTSILKRLKEAVPSPRTLVADLDRNWEACILRCLERDPANRFPSVEALQRSLRGEEVAAQPEIRKADFPRLPGRQNQRRILLGAGAFLLVAVLALLMFHNLSRSVQDSKRRSVAVLGFKNLNGDADVAWLSTAFAEMLTTELATGEQLRTIPGENVTRMKVDLALPESSSFAPDTLARIRSYLGADVVIFGSYLVQNGNPNRVRMDLRLQDSIKGDLLATISDEGYPTELLDLVSRSGAQLRERLGVRQLAKSEAGLVRTSMPANPRAARAYSEALEKLRLFDAIGAQSLLEAAVKADPEHPLARSALATSWSMLGYSAKAKEEAKKAMDLSAALSREDRLLIEGRYREAALEWDRAAEVYRTLFGFFPDNLDYGLRLASTQTSAGRSKDAMTTVGMLRKLSGLEGNSPRIDLAEARTAGALSDFRRQQVLAASAVTKGKAQGARLLVAGARLLEGTAFANLGDLDHARAAFEDAQQMYVAAGDRWDAANSATNLAYILAKAGDPAGAKTMYEGSLETYIEFGDKKGAAAAFVSMANLFRSQGNLAGAKSMHERAIAIYREIGDRAGEATALNNVANVLGLEGNSSEARKMYETALPVFTEIGDRNGAATVLGNLAELLSEKGDFARAAMLYEQSLTTFREVGNNSSLAYALSRLADLLLTQGDLEGARHNHEEALAVRNKLGEKGSVAESQIALAHISLLEGAAGSAEETAKAAVEQFRTEKRGDDEASALGVLARSLLAQQKYAEAAAAIARAEELSSKSANNALRLSVGITTASIRATRGQTVKAANDLNSIVTQARKAGLVAVELEARLALGEIEVASGYADTGQARLAALETEASRKGYKAIADRAAIARSKARELTAPKRRI